jgi:hypothetical protein
MTIKSDHPFVVVIKGGELFRVANALDRYIREQNIDPTVGINAALLLFAAGLIQNGHNERDGHDALDRCYRMLDMEKPS